MANKITNKEKKKRRKSYLGDDKRQDIHERDSSHQAATLQSYLQAAEEFPEEFRVVECIENNELLSSKDIHKKVWKIIERELQL